ncbi:MAG: radical SAM protein [Synergistaceae bacterium]|nr:radical SAM protein [Synergistaceae bacterium]
MTLRVHMRHHPIYALGPGKRFGLWLQGCSIHCDGCISRETWDFGGGEARDISELAREIAETAGNEKLDGLTVSGGEPFDQAEPLMKFLREIASFGIRDVLVYSGYRIEYLLPRFAEIRDLTAAVVDGPFELGGETESCWRGSANQTLSVFRPEFETRYAEWERVKKGRLQILKNEYGVFVAGIPRQGDVAKIKNL